MFHAAFASLSASNPRAGRECSRTHNGLSVETPHDAHSLVVPLGVTATKCVPSRSHLYSSNERNVRHVADAVFVLVLVETVNRLGVKWFKTQGVSSSRKTQSSERPRGTRPAPPVERVVVRLPTTTVSVAVQLLTVGVGRLETVLVGVMTLHSRRFSTCRFSTSSDTCPVEMGQYESFQNESPHSSVFKSSAYSLRIRRAIAPLTVLTNFTRSVVGVARKRMCTWSSSPSKLVTFRRDR